MTEFYGDDFYVEEPAMPLAQIRVSWMYVWKAYDRSTGPDTFTAVGLTPQKALEQLYEYEAAVNGFSLRNPTIGWSYETDVELSLVEWPPELDDTLAKLRKFAEEGV